MKTSSFFTDLPYRRLHVDGGGAGPVTIREAAREADPARRRVIASYLAGGTPVSRVPGRGRDIFEHRVSVSLDLVTDGEWVWPLDAAHYCERYGVLPHAELAERAIERGGMCPKLAQEVTSHIAQQFFDAVRGSR